MSTIVRALRCGGLAGGGFLADALAVDGIIDAVIAEDARELADVGEARQIFQRKGLVGHAARRSSAAARRSSRRKSESPHSAWRRREFECDPFPWPFSIQFVAKS